MFKTVISIYKEKFQYHYFTNHTPVIFLKFEKKKNLLWNIPRF